MITVLHYREEKGWLVTSASEPVKGTPSCGSGTKKDMRAWVSLVVLMEQA